MSKSRAAGWPSDAPTAAQLKEFFAQVESGKVTKEGLQDFLRSSSSFSFEKGRQRIAQFIYRHTLFMAAVFGVLTLVLSLTPAILVWAGRLSDRIDSPWMWAYVATDIVACLAMTGFFWLNHRKEYGVW